MSDWVKFAATWIGSEEVEALGAAAVVTHHSALSLSCAQRTDGWIGDRALRHLFPVEDQPAAIALLVEAGQWERLDGGYRLTRWKDHLLSRDEVERRAAASAESSERHRRHKADDHSMCERCSAVRAGDASRDPSHDTSGDESVTSLVSLRSDSSRIAPLRNESGGAESRRDEGEAPLRTDSRSAGAPRTAASAPPADQGDDPMAWTNVDPPPGTTVHVNGKPLDYWLDHDAEEQR